MCDWLSERLGRRRIEEPPGGQKEPPGGEDVEREDAQGYEQRAEVQAGRRAWELWFIGRTVTLADGTKRPLLGTYRMVWWN